MVEERWSKRQGRARFGSRGRTEAHRRIDCGNPCLRTFSRPLPHIGIAHIEAEGRGRARVKLKRPKNSSIMQQLGHLVSWLSVN